MKRLVFILTVVAVLAVTGVAHASFFDDEGGAKWWMNQSQWEKITYGDMDIAQNGSNLEVTSGGAGGEAFYVSEWNFDMGHDFGFTVGFHYNPVDTNTGGLAMGGMDPESTDPMNGNGILMFAGNIDGHKKYEWMWDLDAGPGGEDIDRTNNDGIFSVAYDAFSHQLMVSANDTDASRSFDMSFLGEGDVVAMALGGGSQGGVFSGSEAYFTNLNITNGTPLVTPEPVSSALFLLGGTAMVVRQYRKRRKA